MPDFTSALFLGWQHPAAALPAWSLLTTGRPAALSEPPAARVLAARWALRQGAECGVVHRSALHALWDVVDVAAPPGTRLLVDAGAYTIAGIAAAGALARGRQVATFRHHDPDDLARTVHGAGGPVVLLTDGWCPGCCRPAPLAAYHRISRDTGGIVVTDDTLAVGVLGRDPTDGRPLGNGGAGTPAWLALPSGGVQVASLAKGYGAPLAVTTGPRRLIGPLGQHGTRWHSSASTAADLAAGILATANETDNDQRRRRLEGLVLLLRDGLRQLGCQVVGRPFPLVSVALPTGAATSLPAALTQAGVHALLRRPRCRSGVDLTFAVTARHTQRDIEQALTALHRTDLRREVAA